MPDPLTRERNPDPSARPAPAALQNVDTEAADAAPANVRSLDTASPRVPEAPATAAATKRTILEVAARLFASKGYGEVTMREIAKAAKRSHTTIYLYFKDKQALLHALSAPPLRELQAEVEGILEAGSVTPQERLKRVGRATIRFCLHHRNTYDVLLAADADRVDAGDPRGELNALRNALFGLLTRSLCLCLPADLPLERQLAVSRIYFYLLRGIVGTYATSREPLDALMARLEPTFDEAAGVLLAGFEARLAREASPA